MPINDPIFKNIPVTMKKLQMVRNPLKYEVPIYVLVYLVLCERVAFIGAKNLCHYEDQ